MNKWKRLIILLSLAGLILLPSILLPWAPMALAQDQVSLQLRWDHQFQFAGYYAAQWQGFYEAEGLAVDIRSALTEDGAVLSATEEVALGRATFGIGAADILLQNDRGPGLTVLASIFQSSAAAFYALAQTPLSNPHDLASLNICPHGDDLIDIELHAMLKAEGIDPTSLTSHPHRPGFEALLRGEVDVIPGHEITLPFTAERRGISLRKIRPATYGIDFYGDSLFTSTAQATADPGLVSRFLRASLRGWRYALEHPEAISTQIATQLPRRDPFQEDLVAFNLFQSEKIRRLARYPLIEPGHINPDRWRRMHQTLRDLDLISAPFDAARFLFDPQAAKQARAGAVLRWLALGVGVLVALTLVSVAWIFSLRRIAARRTAELAQREHHYRNLFENTGFCIINMDYSGVFQALTRMRAEGVADMPVFLRQNPDTVQDLLALIKIGQVNKATLDLLQARDPADIVAGATTILAPCREGLVIDLLSALADQAPQFRQEGPIHALDGSALTVILSLPLPQGEAVTAADYATIPVSLIDITERKQIERALRQSEAKYQSIINTTSEGYWLIDAGTKKTLEVNEALCCMLGYDRDAIIGRSPLDFVDEENRAIFIEQTSRIASSEHRSYDITLTAKDGHGVATRFNATTLRGKDGKPFAGFAFVTDISELKKAEAKLAERSAALERSNAELAQFAYVVSHDLQEPLRTVSSYLSLLQKRYASKLDAEADEFIGFAAGGADRMRQLIRDLLEYSRVGSKGKAFRPVDLGQILEAELWNLHSLIQESGATVTHDPLPEIQGDSAQLARLFQNLIGNALKYRRPHLPPAVHVGVEPREGAYILHFRDNGIGISLDQYERIFMIFQRLHPRTAYGGTGIGLAVCKRIVERHGGAIWVSSEPDEGSTFHVRLPTHPVQPEASQAPEAPEAPEAGEPPAAPPSSVGPALFRRPRLRLIFDLS